LVDGLALQVFEDQVRCAVYGRAAIEQAGDIRMAQPCEDLPFGAESSGKLGCGVRAAHELDRNEGIVFAVGALGEVDRAHSAVADQVEETIGADAFAHARGRYIGGEVFGGVRHTVCYLIAWSLVGTEECLDFCADGRIVAARVTQKRFTPGRIEISGGDEEGLDGFPAALRHRGFCTSLVRRARTCRTEIPRAGRARGISLCDSRF
jgi:hypothetical protein